jgi:hypothetical protein
MIEIHLRLKTNPTYSNLEWKGDLRRFSDRTHGFEHPSCQAIYHGAGSLAMRWNSNAKLCSSSSPIPCWFTRHATALAEVELASNQPTVVKWIIPEAKASIMFVTRKIYSICRGSCCYSSFFYERRNTLVTCRHAIQTGTLGMTMRVLSHVNNRYGAYRSVR